MQPVKFEAGPEVWGPSYWFIIHWFAKMYTTTANAFHSDRETADIFSPWLNKNDAWWMITSLFSVLPCSTCSKEARHVTEINAGSLMRICDDPHDYELYWSHFHDRVNARLGKRLMYRVVPINSPPNINVWSHHARIAIMAAASSVHDTDMETSAAVYNLKRFVSLIIRSCPIRDRINGQILKLIQIAERNLDRRDNDSLKSFVSIAYAIVDMMSGNYVSVMAT